jgi:hypothetical protein
MTVVDYQDPGARPKRALGHHKTVRHGKRFYDHKSAVAVRADDARRADKYRHAELKLAVAS